MKFGSGPFAWDLRILLAIAFLVGPIILFSKVSSASLGGGSFALPAVMGCTGVALLSQTTLTHRLQWTFMPPTPGLEEPPLGQSHNLLK